MDAPAPRPPNHLEEFQMDLILTLFVAALVVAILPGVPLDRR